MDILCAPIYFLFAHTFLGTGLFAVLGFYVVRVLSDRPNPLREQMRSYGFLLLLAVCFLKMFFGHGLAVRLVHALGQDAHGVVTDSYATSTIYNNQPVYGFHVLLALADGRTVQESFRTDTFNVYPPHNRTVYPSEGEHFDARYFPHFPSAFVIIANNDGTFAQHLRCDQMRKALHAAELKHQFAPANRSFHQEAIETLQKYLDAHCEVTPGAREDDTQELQQLRQDFDGEAGPTSTQ